MQQIITGRIVVQRGVSPKNRESWLLYLETEEGRSVALGFTQTGTAFRERLIDLEGELCEVVGNYGRHTFIVEEILARLE